MFKKIVILFFLFVCMGAWMLSSCSKTELTNQKNSSGQVSNSNRSLRAGDSFPNYAEKNEPPGWWTEGTFQLSQDYPTNYDTFIDSDCPVEECTWEKPEYNFRTNPIGYLTEVAKYAFEGNLENDWAPHKNTKDRKWYHAPYMHGRKGGREFIHGLTSERPNCVSQLLGQKTCGDRERKFESWAVSIYNERGAAYIRKVWDEMRDPNKAVPDPANFSRGFPDGSVAVKLLFTEAGDEVSFLKGGISWETDIRRVKDDRSQEFCQKNRSVCFPPMRLLQIDIAVKHSREQTAVVPTSWIFGTFIYRSGAEPFINYAFSSAEERRLKSPWLSIVPVGLMHGNDPGISKTGPIQQSWLNTAVGVPQHYGCGDDGDEPAHRLRRRLSGPIDNPASSCLSCHAPAEVPRNFNFSTLDDAEPRCENDTDIGDLFRNINPERGGIFTRRGDTEIISLDYSLQLQIGIKSYCGENRARCGPLFTYRKKINLLTRDGNESFDIE